MAIKATIHKAQLQIADMDRAVYADHNVIIARHPSETDERMMIRLLAFALYVQGDDKRGNLEFAKDLWDVNEPALWHKDYTDAVLHWIKQHAGLVEKYRVQTDARGQSGRLAN